MKEYSFQGLTLRKCETFRASRLGVAFFEVCWLRFRDLADFRGLNLRAKDESGSGSAPVSVSVVIPTRNRTKLVVKAVASALAQDFSNCEVIVVVDGDMSRTCNALERFADPRLRVIALAESIGGAGARNIGVRAACGEWIAFLDDDDEWLPHKLTRQVAETRQTAAPVISSRMIVQTGSYEFEGPLRSYCPDKPVSEFLFCRRSFKDGPYAMQTSTLLVRRDLMLTVPFGGGLKRHQDWDWILRAERVGAAFSVVDEPLVLYRTEDGRESVSRSQDWEFSLEWGSSMRAYFTPRAYSWFLATECASRAAKSKAGFGAYGTIARRFLFDGQPSLRSAAMVAAFLVLSPRLREHVRQLVRRMRLNRDQGRERGIPHRTISN
jgi:glycosyltransferase involved in cell wall biosynthesis